MKREVIGILAHVDSGKTTLCEAMLYKTGEIRKLGRVDHRDAFLDTHQIEKSRGITIFSKQAVMRFHDTSVTLLDTPGHIDFSPEAERTMQVLDYAILVISGSDGVQSHTETLWNLLKSYRVPVFLFVNKMDLDGADREALIRDLKARLDDGCTDFSREGEDAFAEDVAVCSDALMEQYIADGTLADSDIADAVAQRKLFPCYFGSALKLDGIDAFLEGLDRFTKAPVSHAEFGPGSLKFQTTARAGCPISRSPEVPSKCGNCSTGRRFRRSGCIPAPSSKPLTKRRPGRCVPCSAPHEPTRVRAWAARRISGRRSWNP